MSVEVTGKIFDIRRFSVHDGEGIRTTVFLKGCPLHCVWCQNPEGISPDCHLLHFRGRCIRCGRCAQENPHVVMGSDGYPDIRKVQPEEYDRLVEICPAAALASDCRVMSTVQVMEEVEKDKVFFAQGGGVTISGGEPFAQFDFLLALLQEAKKRGLHTAVETSLFAPKENLEKALPYMDTLYADCKIIEEKQHEKCTGVTNGRILENLVFVLKEKKKSEVIVRTPIIPGFTDSEENIRGIARFLAAIDPKVRYELLNYNPLASAKYVHVEFPFCFAENPHPFTAEEMWQFKKIAKSEGLENVVVG